MNTSVITYQIDIIDVYWTFIIIITLFYLLQVTTDFQLHF